VKKIEHILCAVELHEFARYAHLKGISAPYRFEGDYFCWGVGVPIDSHNKSVIGISKSIGSDGEVNNT